MNVESGCDDRLLTGRCGGVFWLLHDEHAGVGAKRNTTRFEEEDDAATEFAEDAVLLIRANFEGDGVEDGAAVDFVDAEDAGLFQ